MTWIIENLATLTVAAIVLFAVLLAIRSIYHSRRNGKLNCGGNCSFCNITCHENNNLIKQYFRDRGK